MEPRKFAIGNIPPIFMLAMSLASANESHRSIANLYVYDEEAKANECDGTGGVSGNVGIIAYSLKRFPVDGDWDGNQERVEFTGIVANGNTVPSDATFTAWFNYITEEGYIEFQWL
ncbi:MAG: hypothetical protein WCP11_00590 [Candidatus Saccharibacteria bacterium]